MNFTYDVIKQTLQKCLQYSQAQTVRDSVKQAHTYLKQMKNTLKREHINLTIMHSFYALYKNT
jgi:archaellum biogenesis ATPase FlaH